MSVTFRGVGERPSATRRALRSAPSDGEPRVVGSHGAGADEDRVAARAHGVDPVEVGLVRQHQTLVGRVVEAPVERDRTAEQGVGAFSHATHRPRHPASAARRPSSPLPAPPAGADAPGRRAAGRRRAGCRRRRWPRTRRRWPDRRPRPAQRPRRPTPRRPRAGPSPARLRGTADTRSTTRARGSSSVTGVRTPTVRAASTKVARCPPTATHRGDDDAHGRRAVPQRAKVGGHEVQPPGGPVPAHPGDDRDGDGRGDEQDADHGRRRAAEPGQVEGTGEQQGDAGEHGEHELAGRALPRDATQPAADVAPDSAVLHPSPDVAEHPAGQRDVEELGAVAGGEGTGQGDVGSQPARDEPPPPRPAHRGDQGDEGAGGQRSGVGGAQRIHERAGAQPDDERSEHERADERTRPPPPRRVDHGLPVVGAPSRERSTCTPKHTGPWPTRFT